MQKQERDLNFKNLLCKFCKILKFITCRKSEPKIAVISLKGVISNNMLGKNGINFDNIKENLKDAFKLKNVKAVALSINSPGGSPVQTELIYNEIKYMSQEKSIPVFSFIEDIAASGGYWLSLAGEEIYASRSSIVGSIGVISAGFGFKEMIEKLGIERRIYSEGKNKALLDPFEEEKPEDIKIIKNIQHDIYEHFTEIVMKERGSKIMDKDGLFDGACWSGVKAKDLGLIDEIGGLYEVMRKKFGSKILFENIESKKSWVEKRLGLNVACFVEDIFNNFFSKLKNKLLFEKLDQY